MQFSNKPGVKIEFVNPVLHNGLFSQTLVVGDGDSQAKIVARLVKDNRFIKGGHLGF